MHATLPGGDCTPAPNAKGEGSDAAQGDMAGHRGQTIGARTWVLLDVNPHWPWLLERTDSPWYPTATLYRQPAFGTWEPVMEAVSRDLRSLAALPGRLDQPARQA